jgi:hypothetical protein
MLSQENITNDRSSMIWWCCALVPTVCRQALDKGVKWWFDGVGRCFDAVGWCSIGVGNKHILLKLLLSHYGF